MKIILTLKSDSYNSHSAPGLEIERGQTSGDLSLRITDKDRVIVVSGHEFRKAMIAIFGWEIEK
jgi:hypothetical protein